MYEKYWGKSDWTLTGIGRVNVVMGNLTQNQ